MSSNFRFTFPLTSLSERIGYENKIFSIGSCFSQNIADKMQYLKFDVFTNPFGITYNPLSIALGLERILTRKLYTEDDLFFQHELWNSFDHHSDFSAPEKDVVLKNINEQLQTGYTYLQNAKTIIITFGTAYYYELKENRKAVNNCHKVAARNFSHVLFSSREIVDRCSAVIENIRSVNSSANFIFTVSPVIHRNLPAEKNTFSKSHLIIACHELCHLFEKVDYFPAYELMLNDLRDYRFYKPDLLHPNETAIDYIFEKFTACCIEKSSLLLMQQILQLKNNLYHKPRNVASAAHQNFLQQQLATIKGISEKYTYLNFAGEKEQIEMQLLN